MTFSGCWLKENANLYDLYLIHPIYFVNKCVLLPLFLSTFEVHVKSNASVNGNTIKGWHFQQIMIDIPEQTTMDASLNRFFQMGVFKWLLFSLYEKCLLFCPFRVWYVAVVEKWKILNKCRTTGQNPFKPNLNIINQIELHHPLFSNPELNNLNWITALFDYLFR